MKKLLTIAIILLSLSSVAQDNYSDDNDGNVEKRNPIHSFTSIQVSDGIDLYLVASDEESITVSASEEKFLDKFVTEVEGEVLKIYYDNKGLNWSGNGRKQLKAYVSYKTLDNIKATGGATVSLDNTLETNNLLLHVTGGASFKGVVEAKEIDVVQNSGSGITLSGNAATLNVESSSGALFKGYDFVADYCNAKATTGAIIRVTINKELVAKAKTGGGIRYKGNGSIKDIDTGTGGAVKKGDD